MTGQSMEDNLCPACAIPVYPAEAQLAANRLWHKRCYKCTDCNHLLSAPTCHVLRGRLYCKHCLVEATRSASPHLYTDTTKIKPEVRNQGCPRCGGAVFQAEGVVEKGLAYHKKCFTCVKCNRPQDDKLQVYVGFDKEIYCKTCYPKIWHTPLPLDPRSTSRIKANAGDENACKRCGGSVYEAEKMASRGAIFHTTCFNCNVCRKTLDYSSASEYQGEIYCRTCYAEHFDFRSKSVGPGDTAVIKEANVLLNCPRCGGAVFEAEKVVSRKHFFHRKCLSCKSCRRQLDPSSFFDATDGEVYCRGCYSERFGNAARARSVGPIDTGRIQAPSGDSSRCPRCSGRVFEAEKMMAKSGWFHRTCFRCYLCNHLLDQTNFSDGPQGGIYCRTCSKQIYDTIIQNPVFPKSAVETTTILATRNNISEGAEGCRRCHGLVYDAEKMAMRSGAYHRMCFTCALCRRALDYLLAVDSPESNDVFCHSCYQKQFGPTELRVFRHDQENRSLDTSIIKPANPEQGCPKCKGAVYHAEMVLAKGRAYHKSCATCHTCSARLDSLSLNTGPDGNIYCKACSDNHFGSHYGCPYSTVDVKSVKAIDNDQDKCVQCEGKVYEKERIVSPRKSLVFHKECFVCHFCRKKLDGTNSHTSQVYPYEVSVDEKTTRLCCKRCYAEKFEMESGRNSFLDYNAIKAIRAPEGINDPDACRKCSGKVFEAEKVVTRSGLLHISCLTCFECSRRLGPSSFSEASDGKIYCEGCYAVKYGHRARSRSVGPIDYARIVADDQDPNATKCVKCRGKIFDAEKMVTRFGNFHKPCFRCFVCNSSLETAPDSATKNRRGQICCKQCDEREKSIARDSGNLEEMSHVSRSFVNSNTILADKNDPDRCPRCSGKVFSAEMFSMRNGKYHRKCFACCDCRRALDYNIACDGPNAEIFCQPCYTKLFGAHVIYAQTEDKSIRTELIKPADQSSGCPRCRGAVFEAEKLSANGISFHKRCATCNSCNIKLDASSLCSAADGEIYCQGCHSRKFGGAGYRGMLGRQWIDEKSNESLRPSFYVADPSKLRNVDVDDVESTCKKCRGKVFDLEKITSNKSGVWHKQCFSCNLCRTALSSSLAYGYEAPDSQVYCKSCYVKTFGEGSTPMTFSDTKVIAPGKGERGCKRCQGVVFELEKVVAGDHWFHQTCFNCCSCKGKLDTLRAMVGKGGDIYCTTCYKNQMEEDSRPSASIVKIIAEPGDPFACPRCRGKVFEAEKVVTRNKWFHKQCFTCRQCSHTLDQSSVMEGPNAEIYCKTCYVREYFTGGRNKFCDPVQPVSDGSTDDACRKCKAKVFEVDKVLAGSVVYHKLCLDCVVCSRKLDPINFNAARDGSVYCKQCYDVKFGVFGRATSVGRPVQPTSASTSSDRCPTCGASVYEAEKVVTSVGSFHSSCMRCTKCTRQLDVLSCFAGMDNVIYCKNCYTEEFGVSARRRSKSRAHSRPESVEREGFSLQQIQETVDVVDVVAKAMVGTTSILAQEGDPNMCPRCKGKVFEAEKIQSNRGMFHKNCFKCIDCHRALDPSLVFDGFQPGHIFCKKCYLERYGPSVRPEEDRQRERRPMTLATDQQRACPRCSQPVFANEELYTNGRSYHKLCAKCKGCSRQLDFNTVYDGRDKEIYCRGCYGKNFGLHGYGYGGFGSIPALTAGGEEVRMEYHFTQFF